MQINALIAQFLRTKTITVCPDNMSALNMTDAVWELQIKTHHTALEMCGRVLQEPEDLVEFGLTGNENGLVHAYYFADDEDLTDVDQTDEFAFVEWVEATVSDVEWEEWELREVYEKTDRSLSL